MNRLAVLLGVIILLASIDSIMADHSSNGEIQSFFQSKNGTGLVALKVYEEIDISIESVHLLGNRTADGFAFYNIREDGRLVTHSVNFTADSIPETIVLPYAPQKTGTFPVTIGVQSISGDSFHRERTQSISVVVEFSKAMKFSGMCKSELTPFLTIKPDHSTGVCVTMDTHLVLKERGWH
jgi:hypothetical protein